MKKPLHQAVIAHSHSAIFFKKKINNLLKPVCISLVFFLLTVQTVKAQLAVTELSRYIGGNANDQGVGFKTVGGFTYVFLNTTSTNLPVTNGSILPSTAPQASVYLAKSNSAENLVFATYFGGSINANVSEFAIAGDEVYFTGLSSSPNLPVTNGSTLTGTSDIFIAKINTVTGTIGFCTYYGGTGSDNPIDIQVIGTDVYLGGHTTSTNLPVTNGSILQGTKDLFFAKFNGSTGNAIWSTYWGGDSVEEFPDIECSGPFIHFVCDGGSSNISLPSTDGTLNQGNTDLVYAKLDAATGTTNFLTYLGGTNEEFARSIKVVAGEAYIYGTTSSPNFPSTTGRVYKGNMDVIVAKYAANGSLVYSSVFGGTGKDEAIFTGKGIDVLNGSACFTLKSNSADYPVTNGTIPAGNFDIAITKLNSSGNILFSTLIGSVGADEGVDVKLQCDNDIYVFGYGQAGYPVTNGTTCTSPTKLIVSKFNAATGNLVFSSFVAGDGAGTYPLNFELVGTGVVQLMGYGFSWTLPSVTLVGNVHGGGFLEAALIRLNTCPTGYTGNSAVTPSIQNICINGVTTSINMDPVVVPGTAQPLLYISGVPNVQADIPVKRYQWQTADAPGGPWTDIPGAITKSYTPPTGAVSKYYRRLAFSFCCNGEILEQTGDVAAVLVNSLGAPTVDGAGPFTTCAGTPVVIGGSPTATGNGGATITSYLWTPAVPYTPNNTVANPSVSPATSTIYSVLVTDNNGCQQIGQALVNVYAANAGPDKSTCGGQPVRIGSAPVVGVPGIIYSWTASPADPSMSCTNCAQPNVSPAVTTTYTLTMTTPVSGGGNCITMDAVVISAVAAPVNNGGAFGGPDVTICSGGSALVGTVAEPGFVYTWSPGNYLTAANIAQPTFQPGLGILPNPNPFRYYVTAATGGCNFVDSIDAFVIKADAGVDACGPRMIGTADQTPNINETYSWVKITMGAGTSNFLGATNLATVPVSSATVATTFQLTVTFNGVSCVDEVVVIDCGCVIPEIKVTAQHDCASFGLNGGVVSMTASSLIPSTFTWSPSAGLSSSTGATVFLTDNVHRTYTVTATSILDPSYSCINTIEVNNPAWALPAFTAQDVSVCAGTGVNIGQAPVAGYSYLWNNNIITGLNSTTISNPVATVSTPTNFPVVVTDDASGCTVKDTATVTIFPMPVNVAGNDITICGPGTVQLGVTPVPGVTYLWTPAASYNPGNSVANPTVPVAITTTFHVDAIHAIGGCITSDDITVTVNPPVAPFSFTDQTFCPGTAGAMALPVGPGGMASYNWSPISQVINPTSNGPTATTLNPRPSVATTYTLTIANASGCTATASVTFTPLVSIPDAGSNKMICLNGGPVALGNASNPTGGGITYSWSPITNLSDPTSPNPIFTPTVTGVTVYTLTKNEGGCITSSSVRVTVQDFTLPVLVSPSVCLSSCVQIGTTPQIGVTYGWSPSLGLSNANIANPVACPASTTTYTLTAIGVNGCVATQTSIVNVSTSQGPAVTIPPIVACLGANGYPFYPMVNPVGSYNYEWLPNDGTISNIYAQNPVIYPGGVGSKTYSVKVTDQATGCSSVGAGTITVINCILLPVKLENFTATPIDQTVELIWKVSEETNVGRYEVEFSMNSINFSKIGTITTVRKQNYNFLHSAPVKSNNYYRLKIIDNDGSATYSGIRKVSFTNKRGNLTLYPNPASDAVHIVLPPSLINKSASIHIYDIHGKLVLKDYIGNLVQNQTVNTAHLPTGLYAIVVWGTEGIYNSKVIISR